MLFEESIFLLYILPREEAVQNWLRKTQLLLIPTQEYRIENKKCTPEKDSCITLTLTILNAFILTFPHSSSDREKRKLTKKKGENPKENFPIKGISPKVVPAYSRCFEWYL